MTKKPLEESSYVYETWKALEHTIIDEDVKSDPESFGCTRELTYLPFILQHSLSYVIQDREA